MNYLFDNLLVAWLYHDFKGILQTELLHGLTASDADTFITAMLSASCWSNLDTKVTRFLAMHMFLSGTAFEVPVIIHEYVHMFSCVMQAPVEHEQNYIEMWTILNLEKYSIQTQMHS